MSDVAKALRVIAARMADLPYNTGIEKAFAMLADEIEQQEQKFDPKPYIYRGSYKPLQGKRVQQGARYFFGPGEVTFEPREGYEQLENKYPDGWEGRS